MLRDLLTLGEAWTFVVGKGGVGKTTVAASLAVSLADAGERVTVLSVDPAHSLGDALETSLGAEMSAVDGLPGLSAVEVDAETERARFLSTHRDALLTLFERGTLLDRSDVVPFLDLALPGVDELAALLHLTRLLDAETPRRVIIDTAPTGHTLRLLQLRHTLRDWLDALGAMQARHRAVVEAFSGAAAVDASDLPLPDLEAGLGRVSRILTDTRLTRFVLVTTPQPAVQAETRRLRAALAEHGVATGGTVVNRYRGGAADSDATVTDLGTEPADDTLVYVPELPADPTGVEGLRVFAARARAVSLAAESESVNACDGPAVVSVGGRYSPPADRRVYLLAGKGGVGKTTVASALAVKLAAEQSGVLLLSTDPAGSLGDVFGTEVGPTTSEAPGAPGLALQQVDAAGAWAAFRTRHRAMAEGWFDDLLGPGISAEADGDVVSRLIDLAPPGVDEMMALAEVVDVSGAAPYNALVLDTAPTGHLLRLLELPRVGLDWAHTLLRILLKYRHIVGLGSLAERLLAFSRSLHALRTQLEDRAQTLVLTVALPEALSVSETDRLVPRLATLGVPTQLLIINRLLTPLGAPRAECTGYAARLLGIASGLESVGAPEYESGPRGANALASFADEWRHVRVG